MAVSIIVDIHPFTSAPAPSFLAALCIGECAELAILTCLYIIIIVTERLVVVGVGSYRHLNIFDVFVVGKEYIVALYRIVEVCL